jgi:hypothetical protein
MGLAARKHSRFRVASALDHTIPQSGLVADATITLVLTINNGSFTFRCNTAITDASGISTFPNLKHEEAGGYTTKTVSE